MTFNKFLATACGAVALAVTAAQPVLAQESLRPGEDPAATAQESAQSRGTTPAERERARAGRRERAPREQTSEQSRAAVERALTAAGQTCQIAEVKHLGQNEERQMIYEAACANAPGFVILAADPPQVFNCLELAATAAQQTDPNAPQGQLCALPANQNGLELAKAWAQQAGVTCTVDQAMAIGKAEDGSIVYEIGCTGSDGYWLEQNAGTWKARDCLSVTAGGGTCKFTAGDEQAAVFTAKLANTDASDCAVSQVRLMGQNANGTFAEVKCSTDGEGYILRMDGVGAVQQVYSCRIAQRIGGGCTLTTIAGAPATAPATPATEQ